MPSKTSLIAYAIAFIFILLLNFLLPRMMPGNPLTAIYGDDALVQMSPELQAELVERFSLDQPWLQQFGSYLRELFHGPAALDAPACGNGSDPVHLTRNRPRH